MFGYASAFVNGNMFAGTFQDAIVVRLKESDRAALLKLRGAAPFEPMGHPMKEYVVVPPSVVTKPNELASWLGRGHRYAATLPAKRPKTTTGGSAPGPRPLRGALPPPPTTIKPAKKTARANAATVRHR